MKRLILLVMDGDAFRTPELDTKLEAQGWDPVWARGSAPVDPMAEDAMPDFGLFDPASLSPQGALALQSLRARNPRLPLVAMGGPGQDPAGFDPRPLEPLARMDRAVPPAEWPGILGRMLPALAEPVRKFTAEDLFGDILSDLEGPSAPEPRAVPAPLRAAPAPEPRAMPAPEPRAVPAPEPRAVPAPEPPAMPAPEPRAVPAPEPRAVPAPEPRHLPVPEASSLVLAPKLRPMPAPERPAPAPAAGDSHTRPGLDSVAAPASGSSAPAPPAGTGEENILEQFGNYNLLEKVAVGGMAELFKARQRGVHNFEKIVAIKRILPHLSDSDEFVRMFIDEAKLAAQLSHPNIVQIYDLGKASGSYYIAMEYVDGRDLRNLLRKVREYKLPMPEALAAAVIMKVASALDYAHRKRAIDDKELKLVHRDVSPQNILISYEGAVKLVDFGIAKAASKTIQTQSGSLKGKLLYMSPEQALGLPLDGRSDLYSLGLVLAELLTGERCFQADSELGVLEKVRQGKVVDVRSINPGISAEMGTILGKVLQKDLDQRYASARLLERDLKALLARQGYEPTEHDLAEYVNTLLKGTREESESLLSTRFALPAEPPAPRPEPRPQVPPAPTGPIPPEDEPTLSGLEPAPPIPAAPPAAATQRKAAPGKTKPWKAKPGRGRLRPWLLAILGLLAIAAAWAYRGSFAK